MSLITNSSINNPLFVLHRLHLATLVLPDTDVTLVADNVLRYLLLMTTTAPRIILFPEADEFTQNYILTRTDVTDAFNLVISNIGSDPITLTVPVGNTTQGNMTVAAGQNKMLSVNLNTIVPASYILVDLGSAAQTPASPAAALSVVLAIGNTTGGNDIVFSGAGDVIEFTRTNTLVVDSLAQTVGTGTAQIPDLANTTDQFVLEDVTQTLSNKTFTSLALLETGGGADTITFQAPAVIAASYTLTYPIDDGASGEVLSTNGAGVLSWITGAAASLSDTLAVGFVSGANDIQMDNGQSLIFEGVTDNLSLIAADQTVARIATIPALSANDVVVMEDVAQTLTNKILTDGTNDCRATEFGTAGANVVFGGAAVPGGAGESLITTSATTATWQVAAGTGDVVGPGSSTDHAVARFHLATGKVIQNSVAILTDAGALSGLTGLVLSGLTYPIADGAADEVMTTNGAGTLSFSAVVGTGDVVGPASSTDNAVARFNLATGKLIQNSVVLVGDTGITTGITDLTATGTATLTTVDINGGTIDGTTIGGAVAGAGTFTTGTLTGNLVFDRTNDLDVTATNQTGAAAVATIPDLGDNADTFVMEDVTQTLSSKTLDNMTVTGATNSFAGATTTDLGTVTTVDINGGTIDGTTIGGAVAGAGSFTQATIDSLVLNGTSLTSSSTLDLVASTSVTVAAVDLSPTVNGTVELGTSNLGWQAMRLGTPATAFTVTFQAPTLGADYTLTYPVDAGASGEVLSTNGAGVLSWITGAAASLSDTLAVGFVSGANDIQMDNGQSLIFEGVTDNLSLIAADQTVARIATIPALSANDVVVMEDVAQTLTNKTLTAITNDCRATEIGTAAAGANVNVEAAAPGAGGGQALVTTNATTATWQQVLGLRSIWVPAATMIGAVTDGAASAQIETASGINFKVMDFDDTADEFVCFDVAFPKSWNLGTVTYQAFWSPAASNSVPNRTVAWALQAVWVGDDDPLSATYGTAVVVTQDGALLTDLYVTAVSGAVTVTSAADDGVVSFRLLRDVSADDLIDDARLRGIKLFFTVDAASDD